MQEQETVSPEPTGLFPIDESPCGIRDLAGGLREWTRTVVGPQRQWRMIKGGTWMTGAVVCRCAYRDGDGPRVVAQNRGLRLVARRASH